MENKSLSGFGFLLALGLVISTYLVTGALRDIKMTDQIIKVRGYAEHEVKSDWVNWTVRFTVENKVLTAAYKEMESQYKIVFDYLSTKGITSEEMKISSIKLSRVYKRDERGSETTQLESYHLSQEFSIGSNKVDAISKLATEITSLIQEGIELHSNSPQYYYSGVNQLKSKLLVDATQDAKQRAKTLAEGSGVDIGSLKAARQGEFHIRSAKTTNISSPEDSGDSGDYSSGRGDDTQSIQKKITAVVTVDYSMK